jgi:hypothetical protein
MGRATIASAMSTFIGDRPNYGDGSNYWSVAAADRGALPLESFSLNHALLLWGLTSPAAARVEYYLNHYVRGASGLTPKNSSGTNTTAGVPGSIDLKHWRDACAFADSFADLGRWLDLWVEVARAKEAANDPEWITRTWVQVKLMAQYVHTLRANATKTAGIAKGLIYGPAEFDECLYQQHWFSISAWAWRGLLQLQRFLVDTAVLTAEGPFATRLLDECTAFKRDLDAAKVASLVRNAAGEPFFIPPYPAANFTPYAAMPFSNRGSPEQDYGGGAAYANFRYFSEMLSAQFMGSQVDVALADFRESHYGTLSSMTRFRTHLDDMPGQKRHFLRCHLYIKMIILPRQARDKHSESAQKRVIVAFSGRLRLLRCRDEPHALVQLVAVWPHRELPGNRFFEPFIYKNDLFTKTGSGQT